MSISMQRILLEKSERPAKVQVAPAMPKAGPTLPRVVTLMPRASKAPMPSKVKKSAQKTMAKM